MRHPLVFRTAVLTDGQIHLPNSTDLRTGDLVEVSVRLARTARGRSQSKQILSVAGTWGSMTRAQSAIVRRALRRRVRMFRRRRLVE